jgi:hypothetical protein
MPPALKNYARANEGMLTDDEQAELEAYVNIGDTLAY